MSMHDDLEAFEPEVRASFRRRLAELDRLVPAEAPASWLGRANVNGTLARRSAAPAATRSRRAAAPQLAVALAVIGALLIVAVIVNVALRAAPSPVAAHPTPQTLERVEVASFGPAELTGLVLGPDGAGYLIDRTNAVVYRVDLATGDMLAVASEGQQSGGAAVGRPALLAAGGPDILILDDENQLWSWRPVPGGDVLDNLARVEVDDSGRWGDVRAIGAFVTNATLGLYSLYLVDASISAIIEYPASSDGSGYHAVSRSNYLAGEDELLSEVSDMYIDGSLYLVDDGVIERYDAGRMVRGWAAQTLDVGGYTPYFTALAADSAVKDAGNLYAYENIRKQILVFDKVDGARLAQFTLPGSQYWSTILTGMLVRPGADGSDPTLYWLQGGRLYRATLPGVGDASSVSPTPHKGSPAG